MTAQGKITTANAAATPGTRILVQRRDDGTLKPAHRKTGAEVATVQGAEAYMVQGGRRAARLYELRTDLGNLGNLAPSQTHFLAKP